MNEIIKELYDIEERANEIMENAGAQKREILKDSRMQEEMIEKELAGEMEGRLAILKTQLEEKVREEIKAAEKKNKARIAYLNEKYDGNYQILAEEIVKRMTEV